jgi:GWxTD domain-containing protein
MMKKIVYILLFTLVFSTIIFGQKKTPFNVNFDCNRFRNDKTTKYLEIYYSFDQSQFKLIQSTDGFKGGVIVSVKIKSKKNDSIIVNNKWKSSFNLKDTAGMSNGKMNLGLLPFTVPFGEYIINLKGYDENDIARADSSEMFIKVDAESEVQPSLADPELCSLIEQAEKDDKNIFYKNTVRAIPNPQLVFGVGLPIVFVYQEIYGVDKLKGNNYKLNYDIYNASGQKVKSISKQKKKLSESSVDVAQLNCSDIPSSTYVMRSSIIDEGDTTAKIFSFKKFYIYNPHIAQDKNVSGASLISNEYGLMNEDDLDREFMIAKYLANKDEVSDFTKLKGLDAKRNFMSNFWKNRDDDPGTPQNPAKERFVRSVSHVNTQFRTGQKEGWKTDRGRVWIQYGQPDEIERHPNEGESKPYEIWYYNNLEGGVIFVFIDKSTMGDYILVHSTYRNELSDESWQRLLK